MDLSGLLFLLVVVWLLSWLRNLPATPETQVLSLGGEDSLGEGNGDPLPVFLPGKSNGQRSLAGCSPQGRKEWDITVHLFFKY